MSQVMMVIIFRTNFLKMFLIIWTIMIFFCESFVIGKLKKGKFGISIKRKIYLRREEPVG